MKKLIAVSMFAMAINAHAYNLISDVEANTFKNMSSSQISPDQYNKLLSFCDKSDSSIESCLQKIKASSKVSNDKNLSNCCWNVSNQYGDYMYYQGNSYCIPACH